MNLHFVCKDELNYISKATDYILSVSPLYTLQPFNSNSKVSVNFLTYDRTGKKVEIAELCYDWLKNEQNIRLNNQPYNGKRADGLG